MKDKQVIFIAHNWSLISVSNLSYHLALNLSQHHTVVFLNGKGPRNKYERINENLEVYDWPDKRPVKLRDFVFLGKLIKKYRPNIILAHFSAVNVCVVCSKLFGIKNNYIYYHTLIEQNSLDTTTDNKLGFKDRLAIFRKGILYRMAGNIIAVSEYAKQEIIKYHKIDGERITVIHNGIPDSQVNAVDEGLKIGFAGRCDYSKGIDVLIGAVGELLDDGLKISLEIAGSGKQREKLQEHIKNKGWEKEIRFIGSVPYDEMRRFISSLYTFVVPSRIDNLPTVVIEAMACGVPVIASNVGGIPELITNNKTGLLFETGNSDDLAEKISLLVNNRQLRDDIAMNGRQLYESFYTIDRYIERVKCLILKEETK